MNVVRPSILWYTTADAAIPIPSPDFISDNGPVWAIAGMTAFDAHRCVTASGRTKTHRLARATCKRLSALDAGAHIGRFHRLGVTGMRAESLSARACSHKPCAALVALAFDTGALVLAFLARARTVGTALAGGCAEYRSTFDANTIDLLITLRGRMATGAHVRTIFAALISPVLEFFAAARADTLLCTLFASVRKRARAATKPALEAATFEWLAAVQTYMVGHKENPLSVLTAACRRRTAPIGGTNNYTVFGSAYQQRYAFDTPIVARMR